MRSKSVGLGGRATWCTKSVLLLLLLEGDDVVDVVVETLRFVVVCMVGVVVVVFL